MKTHEANYRIRLLNHHTAEAFFKEEVFQTISEATFQSREGSVYIFVDWKNTGCQQATYTAKNLAEVEQILLKS